MAVVVVTVRWEKRCCVCGKDVGALGAVEVICGDEVEGVGSSCGICGE